MNILIIYHSEHHGNTEKIAKAMGQESGATISKAKDIDPEDLNKYDIIGFGSGIYYGKFHSELSDTVKKAQIGQKSKKAFLFSTTGSMSYSKRAHERFRPVLENSGFKIIGEFACPGFDTALTEKGINKGRPDKKDIEDAVRFIKKILQNNK